jgi:hypothetical protein
MIVVAQRQENENNRLKLLVGSFLMLYRNNTDKILI